MDAPKDGATILKAKDTLVNLPGKRIGSVFRTDQTGIVPISEEVGIVSEVVPSGLLIEDLISILLPSTPSDSGNVRVEVVRPQVSDLSVMVPMVLVRV